MAVINYSAYNAEDFHNDAYALIPEGKYRVRIEEAKQRTSQSGKDMIELTLAVSGYSSKLWGYIILDQSSSEAVKKTNQALGTVFDSFNIPHGDLEMEHWKGHVGGAKVNHRDGIDGKPRANVQYFLYRKEVDKLPAWKNTDGSHVQADIDPDMVDFDGNPINPDNPHGIPF